MLANIRIAIMLVGATSAALMWAHVVLMLAIVAVTIAAMIGIYELDNG